MTKPCIAIVSSGLPLAKELDAAIAARFGREGFECLLLAPDAEWLQQTCALLRGQGTYCEPVCIDLSGAEQVKGLLEGLAAGHYVSVLACSASPSIAFIAMFAVHSAMVLRGNGTLLFSYFYSFGSKDSELSAPVEAGFRDWVNGTQTILQPSGVNVAFIKPEVDAIEDVEKIEQYAERCWQLHVAKPVIALAPEAGGAGIHA